MSDPKEASQAAIKAAFPWFDPKLHSAGTGGLFETATGTLLGEDGQPVSEAVRLARAAPAEVETPPAKSRRARKPAAAAIPAPIPPAPAADLPQE